jgi:serine/threonine-protein kinase
MSTLTGQKIKSYTVGPIIGRGGLGDVYQAFTDAGERVAIKVMRDEFAQDPQFQNRFLREIRLMQAAQHSNIVPIHDFGVSNNQLYLVMQLMSGPTLNKLMEKTPFTPMTTWQVLKDIAPAIHAGHERGIIHRDLKPENILIDGRGENMKFYLSDFGLSKRPGIDQTLTAAGVSVGTVEYMAPEIGMGESFGATADIYSLGIMIYEMLVGKVPFTGKNTYKVVMMHIQDAPPALASFHADVPASLNTLVMRAIAKNPSDRFASALDFARAYYHVLKDLPREARHRTYWA